jgi:Spy/CpxP family protein refolding chaperone
MSLRNRFTGLAASLALIITCGVATYAQKPAADADKASQAQFEGMQRKSGRPSRGTPVMRIMRELNLTEAQEQQTRAIVERFANNIEPQRQALMEIHTQRVEQGDLSDETRQKARDLREQIHTAQKQMQAELLALLTPEQRTKYDRLEQEWKARRAEGRHRRGRGERMPPPEEQ